jgi:hypothetical protein
MADSFANLLSPGTQAVVQLGFNLSSTAYSKSATAQQAWSQWESETITALRKATEVDKQNFRAYQVDLENWFKQSNYVEQLRQYESKLSQQASELKTATSISATQNLGKQLTDLDAKFYEEEAAATIQIEALRNKSIAEAASKVAGGQVGRSIERISNTYHQQWLQNASNKQITTQYRIADKLAAAQAASIDAQNKSNSVALYNPRPYADPVQPLAPIPTETYLPKEPSVSGTLSILDVVGATLNATQSYMDMKPPQLTVVPPPKEDKKEEEKPTPASTPTPAPTPAPSKEKK